MKFWGTGRKSQLTQELVENDAVLGYAYISDGTEALIYNKGRNIFSLRTLGKHYRTGYYIFKKKSIKL